MSIQAFAGIVHPPPYARKPHQRIVHLRQQEIGRRVEVRLMRIEVRETFHRDELIVFLGTVIDILQFRQRRIVTL